MILWYRRDSTPFDLPEDHNDPRWSAVMGEINDLLGDVNYRRIATTRLKNGTWISTIWMGLDFNLSLSLSPSSRPLIFETMIFWNDGHNDQDRYSTEEEAIIGHRMMVARARRISRRLKKALLPQTDSNSNAF